MKSRRINIQLRNRKEHQIIEAHKLKGGCGCFIYCIETRVKQIEETEEYVPNKRTR